MARSRSFHRGSRLTSSIGFTWKSGGATSCVRRRHRTQPDLFDSWDPSYTGVALDVRHPFLDLRVLRFLLSVPVIPWCREKYLLRYAFAADLPPQVRRRPKTPLPGSPEHAKIARDGLPPVMRSPRLGAYAESAYLRALPTSTSMQAEAALRLVTFSRWLAGLESMRVAAATD